MTIFISDQQKFEYSFELDDWNESVTFRFKAPQQDDPGQVNYLIYISAEGPGGAVPELVVTSDGGRVVQPMTTGGIGSNVADGYWLSDVFDTFHEITVALAGGTPGSVSFFMTHNVAAPQHFLTTGDDTYTGLAGERIIAGAGNDILTLGAGAEALGEQGDDQITGNGAANLISGGGGNDIISGGGGADTLWGDGGYDHILGGDGDDTIVGGAGADFLEGGAGVDTVSYERSSSGVTVAIGGTGTGGDAQGDQIGADVERVIGTSFDDHLIGSDGADVLKGGDGSDILEGRGGADVLIGNATGAIVYASYASSSAAVQVNLLTGLGAGGDAQGDTYTQPGFGPLILGAIGSAFDDTLIGNSSAVKSGALIGGDGNDVLQEGSGTDLLDGGDGNDTLVLYPFGLGPAVVNLQTGTTNHGDQLISIENLVGRSASDTLTGNDIINRLSGGGGADTLDGGGGSDILKGEAANDLLRGGAGGDTLDGGDGTDTASYWGVQGGVGVNLATGKSSDGDTLISIENLSGSDYADILTGNAGSNTLSGNNGNDLLKGGAGGDTMDGGSGVDTVSYADAASGIGLNLTTGKSSDGDTLIAVENLTGSAHADSLTGNGAANGLTGGGGRDMLAGGGGADRFTYLALADSVIGANRDVITDFSHAQGDRIDLSTIDANSGAAGNQAFVFLGTGAFTGVAGQLHVYFEAGQTIISGDVNGDKIADFSIALATPLTLVAGDFVL